MQTLPNSTVGLLASLPSDALDRLLADQSPAAQEWKRRNLFNPAAWARADQLAPDGDWRVWLILAGRGWGKTFAGAADIAMYSRTNPGVRCGVIAPTYADARDTCVEGDSGLLRWIPRSELATWNRSIGELVLENGSRIKLFSADEPDRMRGPQYHRLWGDELAAWKYAQEAWDMAMFGLRLGTNPQAVVTTTPRPIALVRELAGSASTHVTRGRTLDNAQNLAPAFVGQIIRRYEGTRLGRQELEGEILADVPGALWQRAMFDERQVAPDLVRVVVAIDPAVTSADGADETGIIVAGIGIDGRYYVLADRSCRLSPDGWARRAVAAFDEFRADRIVAEVNNGGEMVGQVIKTVRATIPYTAVHASRGKAVRAEPIAALYEQERVSHTMPLDELEDQLCSWTPDSGKSPDRLDALVWALTWLHTGGTLAELDPAIAAMLMDHTGR